MTESMELDDYSGPFNPDLTFADFSKDFLVRLMTAYQYARVHLATAWFDAIAERFGDIAANDCNLGATMRLAGRVNPRVAEMANVNLNTVLDSLKLLQLPLNSNIGFLFTAEYDIKNENHVIYTVRQCRPLLFYEREAPELIQSVCYGLEKQALQNQLVNPKIKITPLKLPPRQSHDEIACQWEFKLEE